MADEQRQGRSVSDFAAGAEASRHPSATGRGVQDVAEGRAAQISAEVTRQAQERREAAQKAKTTTPDQGKA